MPHSTVLRLPVLASGRKPHVLITCPQNSGCTAFANVLCILLRADACRVDSQENAPRWEPGDNTTFIHKSTINGYQDGPNCTHTAACHQLSSLNTMSTQLASPDVFTHHILLFRDPVQNYISLARKPWCNNNGGFAAKWHATDLSFQAHYLWHLSPFYDAVLFKDWMESQVLYSVLEQLGLREHLIDISSGDHLFEALNAEVQTLLRSKVTVSQQPSNTSSLDALWRHRAEQLRLDLTGSLRGDFHPGQPIAPSPYPAVCKAILAAAQHAPHLFQH
mmetsp:Transcript_48741/g.80981  ORF Transcript_48741/g.80981 Transcript_48741/m.80981 type:complete len:276 (+) Transcript_48741:83-910(+)|eukprot:CAMPEP_0119302938 /NCGR_PEP_ID=MMETSP1333-20130426/4456_1 /TAXON_ID=418940 /ORGANISM="Scyphosphaera apsteinii, Strain RCC1455" /LENGTH=275 /DNA_ID=CAMNT_0007305463 /DNA_START=183 /DNA_END=1010 /DNA_ORIENTATION=+